MQDRRTRRGSAPAQGGSSPELDALRALVEVSAGGLAVLDSEGRFAVLNEAAAHLLGSAVDDLLGRPAPFSPGPASDADPAIHHTVRWSALGGRLRDLEYRMVPLPDSGHVVWFSDMTDVRRQQERLTAIARAASRVAEGYSLPVTLDAVAREIVMTANIAAVQILSVDDPDADLRVLGMAGFGPAADFVERLSACRHLGAHVRFLDAFRTGEPVVETHRKASIMADPTWGPLHEIMNRPDWDGFVSMPMVIRGRTLGVINAYYQHGESPAPGSLAFLEAMGDHAAIAIDTSSLLAQTRTQAQSDERRRLARDLHDSVVQQLFSMRMQAKALRSELDRHDAGTPRVRRSAEELADLSASALADLRQLVFELRPLDLAERGLVDAIRVLAASVQARTSLSTDVHAPEDVRGTCGLDLQEDLYRIVSEAMHNVVKHASATEVEVSITTEVTSLVVEVVDNGAANTDGEAPGNGEQLGLVSMRERTERWGGWFDAGPQPGGGWMVRAAVQLPRGDAEQAR